MVIADDLTGALDAGVHFAAEGAHVIVVPDISNGKMPDPDRPGVDVWVMNAESRHIPGTEAAIRVGECVEKGLEAGVRYFYKKTDSTLRGNVGAELHAFFSTLPFTKMAFVPAYPALGRYTKNGYHYVGKTLVHQSGFGDDPLEPVAESYIPAILGTQTAEKITVISDLKNVRPGPSKEVLVFDCVTEQGLTNIMNYLSENDLLHAISGSAGIARNLAARLSYSGDVKSFSLKKRPVLVINGSLNPVSLDQVKYSAESGMLSFFLNPELLAEKKGTNSELDRIREEVMEAILSHDEILISSVQSREVFDEYRQQAYSEGISQDHFNNAALKFGSWLAAIIKEADIDTLVIFGGDTLMALIRALGVNVIVPVVELQAGIVVSSFAFRGRNINLITKPGGYGERKTLATLISQIKTYGYDRHHNG